MDFWLKVFLSEVSSSWLLPGGSEKWAFEWVRYVRSLSDWQRGAVQTAQHPQPNVPQKVPASDTGTFAPRAAA